MHLPSFLSLGPSAGSPAHIASVLHVMSFPSREKRGVTVVCWRLLASFNARGVHSPGRGSVLSVNVVYKLMPALCCRGR